MSVRTEVQSVLDRYSFTGPFQVFSPRLFVDHGPPYPRRHGPVRCAIEMTVPERSTGEPYVVVTGFRVTHGMRPEAIHEQVWGAMMDRLRHEAGESMRFDDQLLFDPHVQAPPGGA